MRLVILFLWVTNALLVTHAIEFAFNNNGIRSYNGYLWKNTVAVHLSPRIQVKLDPRISISGQVCGFKTFSAVGDDLPFYIDLLDPKYGFADIRIKPTHKINFDKELVYAFEIQAFDCDESPHLSDRVLVRIQVVNRQGPVFDKPHYIFAIGQRNPIGSIVGQIKAIEQPGNGDNDMGSSICNYLIDPPETPFSIDRYGTIRVRDVLNARSTRPYMFQIIAEDCHRPVPRKAVVDVIIEQTLYDCRPGWKNLPPDIEYRGSWDRPELLFDHMRPQLETCTTPCANPIIKVQVDLESAIPEQELVTANSKACRHDPDSLYHQQKLCDIHPTSVRHLLPDPTRDIADQLVGPALGNLPRLFRQEKTWHFDSSAMSVWEVDPKHLSNQDKVNLFEDDFTISFWLRRYLTSRTSKAGLNDDQEQTVFCSQDENYANVRYFSVSLRECTLIVRLLTPLGSRPNDKQHSLPPTMWIFESLPEAFCSSDSQSNGVWHHYAITFSHNPWASTDQLVSLLIDGQDLGRAGIPRHLQLPPVELPPKSRNAKPRVTVGACFDPKTRLTKQHLNGELAGLTLLPQRSEYPNVLRCVAQCGESLLIPNVLKLLRSDINIDLDSRQISVTGQNISHVTDILKAIAYSRPQPGVSPDYTPYAAQSRLLKLHTTFVCSSDRPIAIPPTEVNLNVLPLHPPAHLIESSQKTASTSDKPGSMWVPENIHLLDRPAISQADMEQRAGQRRKQIVKPPPLLIIGSNLVTMEPPIHSPGIPLFSDIQFRLPEEDTNNPYSAAAVVPIDDCFVWPISTGKPPELDIHPKFGTTDGERLEWPVNDAYVDGLNVTQTEQGIHLKGRKPAGVYAKLLSKLQFWPPVYIRAMKGTDSKNKNRDKEVYYQASVGLICGLEAGTLKTSEFVVKIIIENDVAGDEEMMGDVPYNPNTNDLNRYGQPEHLYNMGENGPSAKNAPLSQSDLERRQDGASLLHLKKTPVELQDPHSKKAGISAGAIIACIILGAIISLVVVGTLIWFTKKSKPSRDSTRPGRRRRFATKPADFGGNSLKTELAFRLTNNPVTDLELMQIRNSMDDLASNPCIYSPPTTIARDHSNKGKSKKTRSSIHGSRLAGLEEFQEEEPVEYGDDNQYMESHESNQTTKRRSNSGNSSSSPDTADDFNGLNNADKLNEFDSMASLYFNTPVEFDDCEWIDNSIEGGLDEIGTQDEIDRNVQQVKHTVITQPTDALRGGNRVEHV